MVFRAEHNYIIGADCQRGIAQSDFSRPSLRASVSKLQLFLRLVVVQDDSSLTFEIMTSVGSIGQTFAFNFTATSGTVFMLPCARLLFVYAIPGPCPYHRLHFICLDFLFHRSFLAVHLPVRVSARVGKRDSRRHVDHLVRSYGRVSLLVERAIRAVQNPIASRRAVAKGHVDEFCPESRAHTWFVHFILSFVFLPVVAASTVSLCNCLNRLRHRARSCRVGSRRPL